jgi:hypothetical protein
MPYHWPALKSIQQIGREANVWHSPALAKVRFPALHLIGKGPG